MIRVTGHSPNKPALLGGRPGPACEREHLHHTQVYFLQQKKLFIWNMHYQYKLGDCKIYTVLVSSSRTQSFRRSKERSQCSQKQKSLTFKPNRAELRRLHSEYKSRVGSRDKTNSRGKHFKITGSAKGKGREGVSEKRGKTLNVSFILTKGKTKQNKKRLQKIRFQKALCKGLKPSR